MQIRKGRSLRKSAGITVVLLAVVALLFAGIGHEAALDRAQQELLAVLEANAGNYNEDRVVLSSTNRREAQEMAEKFGGTLRITGNGNFAVIRLPEGVAMRDIAQNDAYRKYHDRISLDYNNFTVVTEDTDAAVDGDIRANFQTDEPMYPQQTYLDYINIGDSWNVSMGRKPDGEKVTVAVIDSGIDTDHPEFTDADGNSIISPLSYNATDDSIVNISNIGVIEDEQGHGTAVAGIIASQINGGGVMGIAPDVELLVIKCDVDETGEFKSSADIVFGIYYAIEQDVDVINMSLGGDGGKDMEDALQLAVDSGIICVAAAGNDSEDLPHYPAAYDTVIGVGALADGSWEIADYSNYGINSDIVAPGTALTPLIDGGYTYQNGTSIAAPIVSAAAAIYKTQDIYSTYEELRADLLAAGKDLGDPGEDDIYGFGALDMNAFICEPKGIISFDYCTEELENTEQVFVRQHTIQTIPEPERENIIFDDWYYDKACTRVFDYDAWYTTEFVEDVILYAKWVNEDEEDASVYNYRTLSDGTIEIVKYKGKRRYLTIPNEIDGKVVSSIGANAFAGNARLREVIFPDGLVYIKAGAFDGVSRMRKITFTGTQLIDIQEKAFQNCSTLRTLEVPDSVRTIGKFAFAACDSLTTVRISENSNLTTMGAFAFSQTGISELYLPRYVGIGGFDGSVLAFSSDMRSITVHAENDAFAVDGNTLYNADKTQLIYYPASLTGSYAVGDGVEAIGTYAFAASKITDIELNAITSIGVSAFDSCKRLTAVVIPDTVVTMEAGAFRFSAIEQITLSEHLTELSASVLASTNLTDIHIPTGVAHIQNGALLNCTYLTTLTFAPDAGIQSIEDSALENCYLLTDFQLPETLSKIGEKAFLNCYAITRLVIPANVSSIGSGAFRYCQLLQRVTFADGCVLSEIPDYCFANCTMLNTVNFSDGITKLGMYAFSSDYLLSSLNFGAESSLTTVGDYCFYTCSALKNIQLPDTVTSIGQFAYAFTGLTEVKLSANVASVGNAAFGACYALDTITADENNAVYSTVDNVLFSKDIDMVYCVPSSRTGSYALPETVKITAPYSFYYDKFLTAVILPDGLEDIQMNSFYNCSSLTGISIPTNVTNIGRKAFENCKKLANVTFAENSKLQRLGIYTFVNCGFAEITIPASVESMAQYVFSNCNNLRTLRFERNSKLPYVAAYLLNGTMVESVVFEDGSALSSLQAHAFDGARYLKSVDFGDASITNVDNYAFYGCTHLERIELPADVTYIGRHAFYDCEKLERMDIPASVDYIGESAFFGTNGMKVFFTADELPVNAQVDWDKGIAGYFLGAVDYVVTDQWEYSVRSDGTIALADYKGTDAELAVDEVDGYSVSRIGARCFYDNDTLTSVSLSSNITEIGNYAFYGCDTLTGIAIPASVERIGKYAFADSNIMVTLADCSVLSSIDSYAFSGNATTTLILPDSVVGIGDGAFYDSCLNKMMIGEGSCLTSIGREAFVGSDITQISLPAALEIIGEEAFKNVATLLSVDIAGGETALMLSNSAFEGSGIQEITIPARVNYIGEYAFGSCLNLESIRVDSANTAYMEIDGVLCDITGTTLVQYPSGRAGAYKVPEQIKVLAYASFKNAKGLTEVTFAEGSTVKTIGWQTFSGCDSLTKITVPDSVVSFDFYAFENCTALTDVVLGTGSQLTGVYEGTFYGCTALERIMLPDTVVEIGDYAFYDCRSLTTFPLTANSQVKGIYDHAFDGCSRIIEIPVFSELMEIGEYAFAHTDIVEYSVGASVKSIANNTFAGCEQFTVIYCDESNEEYVSIEGTLYEKGAISATDYEDLVIWPYANVLIIGKGKTEITDEDTAILLELSDVNWKIADTVSSIGNNAFYRHLNMANITIPDSVTKIGQKAFWGCLRLSSITIPENVKEIQYCAFGNCKGLKQVNYNATAGDDLTGMYGDPTFDTANDCILVIGKNVTRIPAYALCSSDFSEVIFAEESVCKSIGKYAFYYAHAMKEIRIPDSVTTIEESAFKYCSMLERIVIGDGVTEIGEEAFCNCGRIQELTLGRSLKVLGKNAFASSTALRQIYFNATEMNILEDGNNVFAGAGAACQKTTITFGATVKVVPENLFCKYPGHASSNGLNYIEFAEGSQCVRIDNNAFIGCTELESVVIPKYVTSMGLNNFQNSDLKRVRIDSPLVAKLISSEAACGYLCRNVDTILIPCKVTEIGAYITSKFTETDELSLNNVAYAAYSNHTHAWSSEVVEERIACKQDGIFIYTCASCQLERVEVIEAHSFEEWIVGKDATCTVAGELESVCNMCGTMGYKAIEAKGHTLGTWYTVEEATAETEGVSRRDCENCDYFETYDFVVVDTGTCGMRTEWLLKGSGELLISGLGDMSDWSSVSAIPWYSYRSAVTSISILEGVTRIGDRAFQGCVNLAELTLPESLEKIGSYAFYDCESIISITFPDTVTSIGNYAFYGCNGLAMLDLPSNLTNIGSYAFAFCTAITHTILPESVVSIGNSAFSSCTGLKNIIIPESVSSIGEYAFSRCTGLHSAGPVGGGFDFEFAWTTTIPDYAFSGCNELRTIDLPSSITSIGAFAFESCSSLLNIPDMENVTDIGIYAFSRCWSLTSISIPNGVTNIGSYAFYYCTGLTNVSIPESVKAIAPYTFRSCTSLMEINLPDSLTDIGAYAFENCTSLENLTIPENVYQLNNYTFKGCTGLTSMEIPDNITRIGGYVFSGCTGLRKIVIPSSVTSIGNLVFDGCKNLTEIVVDSENTSYSASEGILFNKAHTTLIAYPSAKDSYTIPQSVTDIANYAFWNCTELREVIIPEGVLWIGQQAFRGCKKLSRVEIPNSVGKIGESAFLECSGLQTVVIGNGVESIGRQAFYNCTNIDEIIFSGDAPIINSNAFYRVNATVFYPMGNETWTSSVMQHYGGTLSWKNICSEHDWEDWVTVTEVTCTQDGEERRDCAICDYYVSRTVEAIGHTYENVVTAPNCTKQGYTTHTCTVCGDSYVDTYVNALGHDMGEWAAVTEATCTADGSERCDCSRCDHYETRVINAIGHSFGAWFVNRNATCTVDGENRRNCNNCGHYETEVIPATGHDYESVVTAPTCTEQGYTTHTCTTCADTYADSYVDALGHDMGKWTTITEATCTEDGSEHRECSRCNHSETRTIEAAGHSFGAWFINRAATCTEDGENRRHCSNCGHYETEIVPAAGHDYESVVTVPTCTAQGFTTHTCGNCGDSYVDTYVNALGHAIGDWVTVKEATCTESGSERRDCSRCDHHEARTIEAIGHSYEAVVTAPTCTEQGFTTHTCASCGDSYVDTYVDALGHDIGDWQTVTEATCTEEGSECRDCSRCDYYETRTIKAMGHSFGAWFVNRSATCTEDGENRRNCNNCSHYETEGIPTTGHSYESVMTAPTCTEQGFTTHTCTACGDSYVDAYVDALGHNMGEWTTVTAAACTEAGYERRDCSRCDHYETRDIDAKGHSFGSWFVNRTATCIEDGENRRNCTICNHYETEVIPATGHDYESDVTDPTCTKQGFVTHTCSACGDGYVDTYVDALGHNWDEGVVTIDPTEETEGEMTYTCERCGETRTEVIPELEHVHRYDVVITDPTCTECGFTTHTCRCGDSYVDTYVDALGHDMVAWMTVTEASCTEDGSERRDCSRCDHSETRTIEALGHSFGAWFVNLDATCTEAGENRRDCANCSHYETEVIPAVGHSYESVVTEPTCTEQGFTTNICSACADSYMHTYVEALGHDMGEWTVVIEATCTKDGQELRECARCDYYETWIVAAYGHSYVASVTKSTCTEQGYTLYVCSGCGDSYVSDYVAPTGHDHEAVVTVPTCTEQGYTTYTCHCGDSYVGDYIDALGHDMGDWETVVEATCTETGEQIRECSRCDHSESRDIEALGHEWDEGVVTVEPTEDTEGELTYTCECCSETRTEVIPALEHEHHYDAVVTAPSCTERGYTTHTCRCGNSYVDSYTDALGHDMGEWFTLTEATCTKAGSERRDCSRCDHHETQVIEATGHDYESVVIEPTCTAQGFTTHTCVNCGDSYTDSYTDALGHSFTEYVSDDNAACTQDGTKTAVCDRCDATDTVTDEGSTHGHDFTEWTVIRKPTETAEGLESRQCLRCGVEETRTIDRVENPFADVPSDSFYYEPVMWAVANGVTNGTSATTFGPNDQCMRAHVVTFLWRAVGSPEPTRTDNPFMDVKETDFYYKAVMWALENGITSGMDATHFGPTAYCNRAQVVTFLYRTLGSPEVETTANPFSDVAPGSFYEKPVLWAVKNGITNGLSAAAFGPNAICNRAQIVTFLYRAFVTE